MNGENGARNLFYLMGATLLAASLLVFILSRGTRLAGGLRALTEAKAARGRLIEEARRLDLTYDSALAAPAAAAGKPALWCLRKLPSGPAAYRGDDSRPVYITNIREMPDYAGPKQQTCTDTLVVIGTFTALQFGEVYGARLEARFITYP